MSDFRQSFRQTLVDVRVMLTVVHPMHCVTEPGRKHMLLFLNAAVSTWGAQVTGLPIDFQFQDMTEANNEFGGQPRNPIGHHGAERFPKDQR